MVEFKCRGAARFVGYFDLIVTMLVVVLAIGVLIWNFVSKLGYFDFDFKRDIVVIIIVVVIGQTVAFQIFLSLALLSATKIDADPDKALDRAKLWRGINIVLLLFCVTLDILTLAWIRLIIIVCVRGTFIIIVGNYIDEVTKFRNDNPSQSSHTV